MKRAMATLGVLGLAAFTVAAPAVAANDGLTVCHAGAGGYTPISLPGAGLNGHDLHPEDIIPPNDTLAAGQNWGTGSGTHANSCVVPPAENPVVETPVENPVVETPVENPVVEAPVENPVVEAPAENPVAETPVVPVVEQSPVVQPAAVPQAAAAVVVPEQPAAVQAPAAAPQASAAGATTTIGTNQGYNAQTAVGGSDSAPSWLAGLGALLAAGAAVAVRRRQRPAPFAG